MEIIIKVKDGAINTINDCSTIGSLSKVFAKQIETFWPKKFEEAEKILRKLTNTPENKTGWLGYVDDVNLFDNREPATTKSIRVCHNTVKALYEEFIGQFSVPDIVEDGFYTVKQNKITKMNDEF